MNKWGDSLCSLNEGLNGVTSTILFVVSGGTSGRGVVRFFFFLSLSKLCYLYARRDDLCADGEILLFL